jgi:hypothetical protein
VIPLTPRLLATAETVLSDLRPGLFLASWGMETAFGQPARQPERSVGCRNLESRGRICRAVTLAASVAFQRLLDHI